ncbi:MAG: hypothetical protein NTY01_12265 [Verrucomicrobia bacterium]|nr:hypothetical protein [Verrucomicrobiota bacterium]
MERGIQTNEVLAQIRQGDPPVSYLVDTPKGRLSALENTLLEWRWEQMREGIHAARWRSLCAGQQRQTAVEGASHSA